MKISKEEYFFYEWLIIEKQMSEEEFKNLTNEQFDSLLKEYYNAERVIIKLKER